MRKFKLTFELKQHTPLIHFQSEQTGATLRATELKPKFDRFITQELQHIDAKLYAQYKEIIEDETIFPKDKGSNSYKIFIQNSAINTIETPKAYVNKRKETDKTAYQAPYFAEASKSVIVSKPIKVTITSFNTKLLELLDAIKDYIFIYENFGTRQSKGFGSFLRVDIKPQEVTTIQQKYYNPIFTLGNAKDYKSAFLTIDEFYKKIKMGINKPYEKSFLFQYICKEYQFGWEKKFIKNQFPEVIHGEHQPLVCSQPHDQEFRYIRAMLGLAEHNEFRPQSGKKQVKISSTNGIERFKSPLTFKIFNNQIYVMFNNSYKKLLDEEFIFSLHNHQERLRTPQEFDMYKFFKFLEQQELITELKGNK